MMIAFRSIRNFLILVAFTPCLVMASETPLGAAGKLESFIDEVDGPGPGFAVVVVTADEVLLNYVTGVRRASTGAPLNPDTPIYIASQTKAYMGLLAAALDQRGILSLDSHISDYWPKIDLPGDVDAAEWSLRDLLTHQVPLNVDALVDLEAYVTRVAPADYSRLIEAYGTQREAGFVYDNLGYNIYGAILETATGKTWQTWLSEVVFEPLGMTRTSARTSDFGLDELAWSHRWQGDANGWYDIRPKTDGMMQSAGGIVTSPSDMGAWLQFQLRGSGPEGSGLTSSIFDVAQAVCVQTGFDADSTPYQLPCNGYALGWNLCSFDDHEVYIHGGGYTGARTLMAFSPDLGVGIAAFSNSDNQTGWFTARTIKMYLEFLDAHPDAEQLRAERIREYSERTADFLDRRMEWQAEQRQDERWGGWSWKPDSEELESYTGTFSTGDPYFTLVIKQKQGLVVQWGDARISLMPAVPGLFAGQSEPFDTLQVLEFQRDDNGRPVSLTWDERVYRRVDPDSASP